MTETIFEYRCEKCGDVHTDFPAIAQNRPSTALDVPEKYADAITTMTEDLCVIEPFPGSYNDAPTYFIRGTLDIPIEGTEAKLSLGLWYSQSEVSYERYKSTMGEDQSDDGSFAWATPDMYHFKDMDDEGFLLSTACDLYWNKKGQRPYGIVQSDQTTQLAIHQEQGISQEEAAKFLSYYIHPETEN